MLIGPGGMRQGTSGNQRETAEVLDLLATLNRPEPFDDVRLGPSLSSIALAPEGSGRKGLASFLYQMLLAYHLKLRIERAEDAAFRNYTKRLQATVQAAERWIDGVWVKLPEDAKKNPASFEMHSLVHERQVEGLIRFAQYLDWPAQDELREFIENAYANMWAGTNISYHLWDWLFGTMLPGNPFAFTIMSAMVLSTLSLKSLGTAQYFASGLVLDDRSYWRSKTVIGRVLGGLKKIKAANCWVGPCPVPTAAGEGKGLAKGWWRVLSKDIAFELKVSPSRSTMNQTWEANRARIMGDSSKWTLPTGPSNSTDTVEFRALRLRKLVHGEEGGPPAGSEEEAEPPHRAIVDLTINGQPASFTLHSNPVFIAAPMCVNGPHWVHEQDRPKLQHILGVSQLPGHVHSGEKILIINAAGSGECELAARAWCSEVGQHAIVRREPGACFACTVKAAGPEGLGIGCLIWA